MLLNKNLQVWESFVVECCLPWSANAVPAEQEINIQNMNVELVAQMFKNYRSNVLFHLEGASSFLSRLTDILTWMPSYQQPS